MAEGTPAESKTRPVDTRFAVAVASGKGGVGKSTVTVNLALAMASRGLRVGLLDADIYGPNVPLMLGIDQSTALVKDGRIQPVSAHGIQVMSVGFIAPAGKALIWRGPLANKLIEQFLTEVDWGELDLFLIDLPPGTGDVPLSIIQKSALNGGIIVTTPQEASIADVRKMIDMFQTTDTRILGTVENMKFITCPHCQRKIELYPGAGGAESLGTEVLMELPFITELSQKNAEGLPFFLTNPESDISRRFSNLADAIWRELA
ncbi:MAG: Mrp/NBP35 family ATP-binding protein [Acidobacteriota bacterium]|jgi:ATP-binding protein involved in chromosome partitioning|nr:Mrp/NBP35 family ATP-binding protein [Acidobacteriota bacterium]